MISQNNFHSKVSQKIRDDLVKRAAEFNIDLKDVAIVSALIE